MCQSLGIVERDEDTDIYGLNMVYLWLRYETGIGENC